MGNSTPQLNNCSLCVNYPRFRWGVTMDGYQFTAAMFQSLTALAWPGVTVVIAWLYRDSILRLVHRLQGNLKGLGFELNLAAVERQAEEIVQEAKQAPEDQKPLPPTDTGMVAEPTKAMEDAVPAQPMAAQSANWTLRDVAAFLPAAAFTESMAKIGKSLRAIIANSELKLDGDASPTSMAMLLANHGLLTRQTSELVAQLESLERAAKFEHPTTEQADRFLATASTVQQKLQGASLNARMRLYQREKKAGRAL